MSFVIWNSAAIFLRYMLSIYLDLVESTMDVFRDEFSIIGDSFEYILKHFGKFLKQCVKKTLYWIWRSSI